MNTFTYQLNVTYEKYMIGILSELKRKKEFAIFSLLKGASVSLEDTGRFSAYFSGGGRSDAHGVYINFQVNPNNIDQLEKTEVRSKILYTCERLIHPDCGFDVKGVDFTPDLEKNWDNEGDLSIELEGTSNNISSTVLKELLPEDIKNKGYEMSEVYTFLYAIENSLRLFIKKVGGEKLVISSSLKKTIEGRKEDERKNLWLSVRGDSDLFYLDFKDLRTVIISNWGIFEKYFPSQEFLTSKITEIAQCRNKIAHNSYIDKDERELMRTYYKVILGQISNYDDV